MKSIIWKYIENKWMRNLQSVSGCYIVHTLWLTYIKVTDYFNVIVNLDASSMSNKMLNILWLNYVSFGSTPFEYGKIHFVFYFFEHEFWVTAELKKKAFYKTLLGVLWTENQDTRVAHLPLNPEATAGPGFN